MGWDPWRWPRLPDLRGGPNRTENAESAAERRGRLRPTPPTTNALPLSWRHRRHRRVVPPRHVRGHRAHPGRGHGPRPGRLRRAPAVRAAPRPARRPRRRDTRSPRPPRCASGSGQGGAPRPDPHVPGDGHAGRDPAPVVGPAPETARARGVVERRARVRRGGGRGARLPLRHPPARRAVRPQGTEGGGAARGHLLPRQPRARGRRAAGGGLRGREAPDPLLHVRHELAAPDDPARGRLSGRPHRRAPARVDVGR